MTGILFDIFKVLIVVAVIVRAWVLKWRETHPYPEEKMVETEGEIVGIRYSKFPFRSAKKQTALIVVRFTRENGRPVNSELSTVPTRFQLETKAPEIQEGAKFRIRYRRRWPYYFRFADSHLADPEVCGRPRGSARFGWFGLISITLAGVIFLGLNAFFWWVEYHY